MAHSLLGLRPPHLSFRRQLPYPPPQGKLTHNMAQFHYTQTAHLSDGHSKGITSVAFNPDVSLLATGGLDGMVCVWNTVTWLLVDIYYPERAVTALTWLTGSTLICGLQDGVLSSVVKVEDVSGVYLSSSRLLGAHFLYADNDSCSRLLGPFVSDQTPWSTR